MAEGDFQEKTEEPTAKKLADGRKKGQVAKSQELTSSFILMMGMLLLYLLSGYLFQHIQQIAIAVFTHLTIDLDSTETITYWFRSGLQAVFTTVMPLLGALFVGAFIVTAAQVGFLFTVDPLKPKWKTINVFDPSNYKRYFDSKVFVRLALGVGKMIVVSFISYLLISQSLEQIYSLGWANSREIFVFLVWQAFVIGVTISLLLLVLGIIDYAFQAWKFRRDMKMTKQEVKEERKQTEGDVHVKSKMRSMMQAMTRNRMKDNVPKADVIVANPVHFAIALKYDADTMPAPICLAKGARKVAIMIKELAHESGVPIVENPPLAQNLYKTVEIGMPVPADLYHGVAEVLAYVYRLNEQAKGKKIER